ncbi:MAG: hypothetical protein IPI48_18745 [bacterium]|nr:hypothetical protein [bacterium]
MRYGIVSVLDPRQRIERLTDGGVRFSIADPRVTLRELLPVWCGARPSPWSCSHLGESGTEALLKEMQGVDIA